MHFCNGRLVFWSCCDLFWLHCFWNLNPVLTAISSIYAFNNSGCPIPLPDAQNYRPRKPQMLISISVINGFGGSIPLTGTQKDRPLTRPVNHQLAKETFRNWMGDARSPYILTIYTIVKGWRAAATTGGNRCPRGLVGCRRHPRKTMLWGLDLGLWWPWHVFGRPGFRKTSATPMENRARVFKFSRPNRGPDRPPVPLETFKNLCMMFQQCRRLCFIVVERNPRLIWHHEVALNLR